MAKDRKISFIVSGVRWQLELGLAPVQNVATKRTIDLAPCPLDALELTISGSYPGGGGQCDEELARQLENIAAPELRETLAIWKRWHLNAMKAGTRAQAAYLETLPKFTYASTGGDVYGAQKAALAEAGLEPDMNTGAAPYSYGSAWLAEPLPVAVAERVNALFSAIDGERFGSALSDPAEMPEAPWSTGADQIAAEDVQKHLEALREFIGETDFLALDEGDRSQTGISEKDQALYVAREELIALERYESTIDEAASNGEYLIADDEFETHAQQMAEDCGMVNADASWPNNHIDWTAAARELKQDYEEVWINDHQYWVR